MSHCSVSSACEIGPATLPAPRQGGQPLPMGHVLLLLSELLLLGTSGCRDGHLWVQGWASLGAGMLTVAPIGTAPNARLHCTCPGVDLVCPASGFHPQQQF